MIAALMLGLQVVSTPVDAANVATKADVRAVESAMPAPCDTVPLRDTLTGTIGTGSPCTTRPDATRPTVIQAKTTVTAADATYSVTFDAPFASTPIYADARVYGASQPYLCTVTTLTATGAAGKCFQLVATTLPVASTALLGLVISPIASAASGLSVRVVARQ